MGVPMTLDSARDLIDVAIQRVYPKITQLPPGPILELYREETTEDYYDKDSSLSGFSESSRMIENSIITSESPVQGFDKTYTQLYHGNMGQFTLYDWKYGIKKRKLESVLQDLVGSCKRRQERLLTRYLEESFEDAGTSYSQTDNAGTYTVTVTGGDGTTFVSSAHTREDGGSSWSNEFNSAGAGGANDTFDLDGLKGSYDTAARIPDPKGNLMDINYNKYIFPKGSANYFTAMEINGALKKNQLPESNEFGGAPFAAFEMVGLPYLTGSVGYSSELISTSGEWWGFDTSLISEKCGLQLRTSQDIEMDPAEKDYKTKSIYVSATHSFDYGHNDSRNAGGTDGSGN